MRTRSILIAAGPAPTYADGDLPPIVIGVLQHIYAIAAPLEDSRWKDSPARRNALKFLLDEDLIVREASSASGYSTTERGDMHCAAIRRLKLPPRSR